MSESAVKTMTESLIKCFGNPSSLHAAGEVSKAVLEHARSDIAAVLGCAPEELVFTSSGSEADNQAMRTGALFGEETGRKHIVASAIEHSAVLKPLRALEAIGFSVTYVDASPDGEVPLSAIAAAIRDDTCMISLMFANNETGVLQPVFEVGRLCRERGILFHTDAVQAVGAVPVDLSRLPADLLSFSAHKFGGPKGVGGLYVRNSVMPAGLILGGGQEKGRRAGTENVAGIAAMAAALTEKAVRMKENAAAVNAMRSVLIEGLSRIDGALFNGRTKGSLPGTVNFSFDGLSGEALVLLLSEKGICVSSGAACTSGELRPSRVLLSMGRTPGQASSAIRISLNEKNTPAEAEAIVRAVTGTVNAMRKKQKG